jgi:hypothetical protein
MEFRSDRVIAHGGLPAAALMFIVAAVDAAPLRSLSDDQWREDIQQAASSIKETHPAPFRNVSEEQFDAETTALFDDGLFVVSATREHRALVGARVVAFEDTPVDTALEKVVEITFADNSWRARALAPSRLEMPDVLAALGIAAPRAGPGNGGKGEGSAGALPEGTGEGPRRGVGSGGATAEGEPRMMRHSTPGGIPGFGVPPERAGSPF